MKTKCVGSVAFGSHASIIATALLVNLVVILITNVQLLVLINRVSLITTVQLVSPVVILITNVQQETAMRLLKV